MNVFAPDAVSAAQAGNTEVTVNVFAGSEQTRVALRLGENAAWTPLSREPRKDPYYVALTERDQLRDPRPRFFLPPAIKSPHLWVGTLPENPAVGTHTLEIRAVDRYGRVHRERRKIRVR